MDGYRGVYQGLLIVFTVILIYLFPYPFLTATAYIVTGSLSLLYLTRKSKYANNNSCSPCTSIKSIKPNKQGGNDIDYLLNNLSKATILGQGGAGIVYTILDDPVLSKYAYKMSKDMGTCREWKKEYNLTIDLQNKLKHLTTKYVKFVPIEDYHGTDLYCVMKMPRIRNPDNVSSYAIHTMFGEKQQHIFHASRGLFLGYDELKAYIPDERISECFSELGLVLGNIHYAAKYDGYDLEVILGVDSEGIKLNIIDFDLISPIEKYDETTKDRLFQVLAYVPYFPTINTPHYPKFKNAYLKVANDNNLLDFAESLMNEFEAF